MNGCNGTFTKAELGGILERKDYRSLVKAFKLVAVFIDRCTEHGKKAPMARGHKRYNEIFADVKGDVGQHLCIENDLVSCKAGFGSSRRCW